VNSKRDFRLDKRFLVSVICDYKYIRKLPAVNKHHGGCKSLKGRQCTCKNIEARSRNRCCSGKAINIT